MFAQLLLEAAETSFTQLPVHKSTVTSPENKNILVLQMKLEYTKCDSAAFLGLEELCNYLFLHFVFVIRVETKGEEEMRARGDVGASGWID